jgi:hypothetical protein
MGPGTCRLPFAMGSILLFLGAGRATSQQPADSGARVATAVVEGYLAAYNSHDESGLRRWLADTVLLGQAGTVRRVGDIELVDSNTTRTTHH